MELPYVPGSYARGYKPSSAYDSARGLYASTNPLSAYSRSPSSCGSMTNGCEITIVPPIGCSEITRISSQLMEQALASGIMSKEVCMQMHARVVKILDDGIYDYNQDRGKINKIVTKCIRKVEKLQDEQKSCFEELLSKIRSKEASQADIKIYSSMVNMFKEEIDNCFNIAERTIKLINSKDNIGRLQGLLAEIFKERMNEIRILREQLRDVIALENHSHKIDLENHNQRLKEENQYFSQFLNIVENATQKEREQFEMDLTSRILEHQQQVDDRKITQEEKQKKWKRNYKDIEQESSNKFRESQEQNRTSEVRLKTQSEERLTKRQMKSQEKMAKNHSLGRIIAPAALLSAGIACTIL